MSEFIYIEDTVNGYTRVNLDYLVLRMPMYDLDEIVKRMNHDLDPERKFSSADKIIDLMISRAFNEKTLSEKRFWRIVRRLKKLGILESWTEDKVHVLFKEEGVKDDFKE